MVQGTHAALVGTMGGWQMDSPPTNVGTGEDEPCRAAELLLSVPEKDTSQRRRYTENKEDVSSFNSHFMLDFVWKHRLRHCHQTGGLRVGLGWRGTSLQHFRALRCKLQWWVRGLGHEKLLF